MKKLALLATGLALLLATGCNNQESTDKNEEVSIKTDTKQLEKESTPIMKVSFQSQDEYNKFKVASKSKDYSYKLINENSLYFTSKKYYPDQNFEMDSVTRYIKQEDGFFMAVDGYSNYIFLENEEPKEENFYEVSAEEEKYIRRLLAIKTGDTPLLNSKKEIIQSYEPTEENFESHKKMLGVYNSVLSEFYSVFEAQTTYFNQLKEDYDLTSGININSDNNSINSYIATSNEVYKEKKDLLWKEVSAGTDEEQYDKLNSLDYIKNIGLSIDNLKDKISQVEILRDTLSPIIKFYEKYAEYNEEKIDGVLMNEEDIKQVENEYDDLLKQLNNDLKEKEEVKGKLSKSYFNFLLQ